MQLLVHTMSEINKKEKSIKPHEKKNFKEYRKKNQAELFNCCDRQKKKLSHTCVEKYFSLVIMGSEQIFNGYKKLIYFVVAADKIFTLFCQLHKAKAPEYLEV